MTSWTADKGVTAVKARYISRQHCLACPSAAVKPCCIFAIISTNRAQHCMCVCVCVCVCVCAVPSQWTAQSIKQQPVHQHLTMSLITVQYQLLLNGCNADTQYCWLCITWGMTVKCTVGQRVYNNWTLRPTPCHRTTFHRRSAPKIMLFVSALW